MRLLVLLCLLVQPAWAAVEPVRVGIPLSPRLRLSWDDSMVAHVAGLPHLRAHALVGQWKGRPFELLAFRYSPEKSATLPGAEKYWDDYAQALSEPVVADSKRCESADPGKVVCRLVSRSGGKDTYSSSTLYWFGGDDLVLLKARADRAVLDEVVSRIKLEAIQ